jgi:hypothetical protein
MQNFLETILPANYWLSKSMEFTKRNSCGTLWYLKKWFTCYYFVFLKDEIFEKDYKEMIKIFENFIQSLPKEIQKEAENYFFEVDIRKANVTKLAAFIATKGTFENETDKKYYENNAKKFYFMYLMNLGGQSGYKKMIKEFIEQGFTYEVVIEKIRREIINQEGNDSKLQGQISDFPAPIRNERQIFFYYGFFQGKETADLSGFYNLTHIGKAIIQSNFYTLLLIWEHQKIKMVSQSPLADIQKLPNKNSYTLDYQGFSIHSHPYLALLEVLQKRESITLEQYQYVIAKTNNTTDLTKLCEEILADDNEIQKCKNKIFSFARQSEVNSEDFTKELKKLILGICEMPKDYNKNPMSCISWLENNKLEVKDAKKLTFILKNYTLIKEYLDDNFSDDYSQFEISLRTKYLKILDNEKFEILDTDRYNWYQYIINFDKTVILHLIYVLIALELDNYNFDLDEKSIKLNLDNYVDFAKKIGISKADLLDTLLEVQENINNNTYLAIKSKQDTYFSYKQLKLSQIEINVEKLEEISKKGIADKNFTIERKRKGELIDALRNYYHQNYRDSQTKLLKCDCCKEETFLTEKELSYIEFHHLIPFSTDLGPDHYLNLIGICANCHRKLHFARHAEKQNLYANISTNNQLSISLLDRMKKMLAQKVLEPINIEFLKKEGMITQAEYNKFMNNEYAK